MLNYIFDSFRFARSFVDVVNIYFNNELCVLFVYVCMFDDCCGVCYCVCLVCCIVCLLLLFVLLLCCLGVVWCE